MLFDGRQIANFILDHCDRRGREITNLSLQKILFFCHVWSLVRLNKPLIRHQFEAWQLGPVLQYVYREFKDFEHKTIDRRAMELDPRTGSRRVVTYSFDQELESLLGDVVDFYSQVSANDLVDWTHVIGGPWERVWNHTGSVNPGMKIENDAIVAFYSRMKAPFSIQ